MTAKPFSACVNQAPARLQGEAAKALVEGKAKEAKAEKAKGAEEKAAEVEKAIRANGIFRGSTRST